MLTPCLVQLCQVFIKSGFRVLSDSVHGSLSSSYNKVVPEVYSTGVAEYNNNNNVVVVVLTINDLVS